MLNLGSFKQDLGELFSNKPMKRKTDVNEYVKLSQKPTGILI